MNQARFSVCACACACQRSFDRPEVEATSIALIDAMTRSSTSGSETHSPAGNATAPMVERLMTAARALSARARTGWIRGDVSVLT